MDRPTQWLEHIEETADTNDAFARLDQAMDVRRALDELGEPCREVLRRYYLDDQSYAEISAALDLPMGTLSSRIARCLARLGPVLR